MARLVLASVCFLWLAGCTGGVALGPDAVKGKTPDGTIEMHEVQAAYIGSGSGGAGVLFFRGVAYPFDVGGVGVGGIGLSTIEATGEVYNLPDLGQFPAPMVRPATALRSAPPVAAISGCRTRRASSCT